MSSSERIVLTHKHKQENTKQLCILQGAGMRFESKEEIVTRNLAQESPDSELQMKRYG
jgi:hypothetical protein